MDQVFIQLRGRYGVSEVANRLGLTRQAVSMWFSKGRIPASRALAVAKLVELPVEQVLSARWVRARRKRKAAK